MEGLRGARSETWTVNDYAGDQVGIKLRNIWSSPKQGIPRHSGRIKKVLRFCN